jgi:hypothetical protein
LCATSIIFESMCRGEGPGAERGRNAAKIIPACRRQGTHGTALMSVKQARAGASALPHPTSVQYCHFRVSVTPHLLRLKRRCICTMHPHVKMFARKGLCKNACVAVRQLYTSQNHSGFRKVQVADNHINTLGEMYCIPRTPIR